MNEKITRLVGSFALLAATLTACVKEEYDMDKLVQNGTWKPEIAMPLVHSTLTVEDIISPAENTKDDLQADPDGLMVLVYRDTLFSKSAATFVTFNPGVYIINDYTVSDTVLLDIDSIDLNLEVYNKVVGGTFYFENPTLRVIVTNSIGIPIDMALTVLDAWSPVNGTLPIELWGSPAPVTLSPDPYYPIVPGDTAVTIYSFDETNSNVKDFLQIGPKYIFYSVQGITNNPVFTPNFITDTSRFSVEVEVRLPLYGTANFVTLGDTVPFELSLNDPSGSDLTVTEAVFMVNTYNGFPADVEMQLLFMDSSQVIIDSLFSTGQTQTLQAAPVGPPPALRVTESIHTVTEVYVDKARLDNLGKATKMIVVGRVTTTDNGAALVKIYSNYTIEIKLAVQAKLQVGQ